MQRVLLKDTDAVEVITENNHIIIKKLVSKKTQKTLQERFENFEGVYSVEPVDWGTPEGREIW